MLFLRLNSLRPPYSLRSYFNIMKSQTAQRSATVAITCMLYFVDSKKYVTDMQIK